MGDSHKRCDIKKMCTRKYQLKQFEKKNGGRLQKKEGEKTEKGSLYSQNTDAYAGLYIRDDSSLPQGYFRTAL